MTEGPTLMRKAAILAESRNTRAAADCPTAARAAENLHESCLKASTARAVSGEIAFQVAFKREGLRVGDLTPVQRASVMSLLSTR